MADAPHANGQETSDLVREFTTHWDQSTDRMWHTWRNEDLLGTIVHGGRGMPRISPWDFTQGRSDEPGAQPRALFSNDMVRYAVDNPSGPEGYFRRCCDYDTVIFQFSGRSQIECEYGRLGLDPGMVAIVPAGVSHRSIGSPSCRRLLVYCRERQRFGVDPDKPLFHSHFDVAPESGEFLAAATRAWPGDPERDDYLERMTHWDSKPTDAVWIRRNRQRLVGAATEGRPVQAVRAFDYFDGITGLGGKKSGPGPLIIMSQTFSAEVYNTEGLQFGYHRGCPNEEIWMQFRGHAENLTEHGLVELDSGQMSIVPPGVAHRIHGSKSPEGFLRFVMYVRGRLEFQIDPATAPVPSRYRVRTVYEVPPPFARREEPEPASV